MELVLVSLRVPSSRIPTSLWKDEDLVEECLRGNEQAWAAVVDKYKDLVYSAPIKSHMSSQDAADVFQQVWLDLYTELENLRQPGALSAWLIFTAWHKSVRWKRKRLPVTVELAPREMPFPEWEEQAERQQILRDTIARLPESCQRLVNLLFHGHPPIGYAEAARQLGLAEGSIGLIRGRCLEVLRAGLEQKGF